MAEPTSECVQFRANLIRGIMATRRGDDTDERQQLQSHGVANVKRLLPSLIIGTVDKFAQLTWRGETEGLCVTHSMLPRRDSYSQTAFLVNAQPRPTALPDSAWLFQARLVLAGQDGGPVFLPRGPAQQGGPVPLSQRRGPELPLILIVSS